MKRRFRFSTYHTETKVSNFLTTMGLALVPGWNIVQLSLAEFTRRAYRSLYLETLRIQVHASCRLRKIYFSDHLYDDHDLPNDYKLCLTGITRWSIIAPCTHTLIDTIHICKIIKPLAKLSFDPCNLPTFLLCSNHDFYHVTKHIDVMAMTILILSYPT